ncbi:MAG: SAM-dependent chlorinase/fluorinase [Gammaproteobacteria bacterium]|nr:SAM-dependent chlorinase/fluorinase [Gammaproteobacteria bacterium]MDH3768096.1 SAM-dependent chlorinase/fluorinase [Gammaproteobacteria bacterium]
MSFVPSGVITLTTDFGHHDVFVGTMKGQVLRRFTAARIVDLTHGIQAHWPDEAGFWLAKSYQYFPTGTIHIAVVDPGVGTGRDIIALELDDHLFLAPDNGLLGLLSQNPKVKTHRLDITRLARFGIEQPSSTFHGRDIFAPIAAELAAGHISAVDIGPSVNEIVPRWQEAAVVEDDQVSGVVITTDSFGNLITNIEDHMIRHLRQPIVLAGGQQFPLRQTYGDVQPGQYLALINSFGVVEIACAESSAAQGLGLGRNAPIIVRALD